jgi:heavy metal sensor kinase
VWSHFEELAGASALALPVALALAGFAGYLLARQSLDPLEEMACRAEQITSARLDERLPVGESGDELSHLARVFNHLLARLEQSFEQLRRFTSDASHELRTPLASLRSIGEVGLQADGSREDYRDMVGSMLEEVNRLTHLVDSLLTIARADAGHLQFHQTSFSAMDLARESSALFEVLMEEKSVRLELQGDESAMVYGDRTFLRQALVNVIHNAVKFSPAGGVIWVRVGCPGLNTVRFEVSDSGPGVPVEHSVKIFDRFYRVERARSRETGGVGLGLSIAQWAVTSHGGSIRLAPAGDESGATFLIDLPVMAPLS